METINDFLKELVPDDSSCYLSPISTLVFMDLESTGLPYEIGRKNVHITEMSFIAIDRQTFSTDSCRVLNKLSLCVRPRANISFGAMEITGLYDDMLQDQEKFDKTIPILIKTFFKRLRPPICLLAHNGNRFDFPLLQAELKRIRCNIDREILCADTLEAFKSIMMKSTFSEQNGYGDRNEIKTNTSNKIMINQSIQTNCTHKESPSMDDDEVDKLLSTDMDIFKNIDMLQYNINESTPVRSMEDSSSGAAVHHAHKPKFASFTPKESMQAKRKLYFSDTASPKIKKETDTRTLAASTSNGNSITLSNKSLALDNLYMHFFNESPIISHNAEADCITLQEVCKKVSDPFLKYIDEKSVAFCDTIPMW